MVSMFMAIEPKLAICDRSVLCITTVIPAQKEKKEKEATTPFGVNLMRSQVLYRAAQVLLKI